MEARGAATAREYREGTQDAEKVKGARLDLQRRLPGPALQDRPLQIQRQRRQSRRDAGATNGNGAQLKSLCGNLR